MPNKFNPHYNLSVESKSSIDKELKITCELIQGADHYKILYKLLENRKHSISHKEMPTYKEHEEFCKKYPYRLWFIVFAKDLPIGSFYLTKDNRIGINFTEDETHLYSKVIEFIIKTFKPLPSRPSVVPDSFFCNISPTNTKLIEVSKKLGGNVTQISVKF